MQALTDFIFRPAPKTAKPEELEAYRFLRREAIESLGLAGAPAVAAVKFQVQKIDTVEGPIAPILLRVLMPGGLTPEASLAERNEAALALCSLKPLDKYDPAPTYYFINQTLFDLCRDYSEDFSNIGGGAKSQRRFPGE